MRINNLPQILYAAALSACFVMAGCGTPTVTTNTTTNAPRNTAAPSNSAPSNSPARPATSPAANTNATTNPTSGTAPTGGASNITLRNDSNYDIHHFYLSPTSAREWGPDQLGTNVMTKNGGTYTLTGVPCGNYDVRLVDQDGDECIITNAAICNESSTYLIGNDDLLSCQGWQ